MRSAAATMSEREAEREADMARRGLLPHWTKDERIAFKMINARAETLTVRPA
jgi:putative SOS response-associated peptidase YedK